MKEDASHSQEVVKNVRQQDQATVVELAGDIDMRCSMELRGRFIEIMQAKPPLLVVNMIQVEFMDSSGLATLVEVLQWCRRNKCQLKLVGLTGRVRSIFEISRLESIFQIFNTEVEALA